MTDGELVRRELGRRLAGARKAAGMTQVQLAAAVGYARSTVSNAEIGRPDVAREFWARCDEVLDGRVPGAGVLGDGVPFSRAFDQIRTAGFWPAAGPSPEAPGAGIEAFTRSRQRINSAEAAEALAGYRDLGWPVEPGGGGLELVTGDGLEALELPRAAGMLATSWWLYSQGHPDEVRRLPALPHPAQALALITAGGRCFFLAAAGGFPWTGDEPVPASPAGPAECVIRWHAGGSRVPVPPSRLPGGERVAWAHLPSRPARLPPSVALLGLLATAASAARVGPGSLILPGGIEVLPAPPRRG